MAHRMGSIALAASFGRPLLLHDAEAAVRIRIAMAKPMSPRKRRLYALAVRRFHGVGCDCLVGLGSYNAHHWACGVNRA